MKRLKIYLLALVGLLCLVTAIRADEMKIEEFYEAAGDLSAATNQRRDLNDNVCALVRVVLPQRGADFEGNVIGDVEFKSGEYWVYMTPGSKMLRVKHENAKPIMIDFTDYGIPALEPKTTYTLVITPPNISPNKGDGANGSYLVLDITPKSGAIVEVDGKLLTVEDGQASTFLRYGNYTYTVRANGYDTYTGTAKIEKGINTTIPVKLESNFATLTIKPETSGATIKINGKQRGTDTFKESIASGTYLIEVEKPGHQPWKETIEIAERENKTLSVPALQPIYGSLNIDYKPIGSTVSIDGKTVGTTPAMIGDLLIGSHTVTISKEGFDTFSSNINISEAETTSLSGALDETTVKGLIPLEKNGKWGFIDKTGKVIVPFKYDAVRTFLEGLARVKLNGKWGYIDETGKEVIRIKYDDGYAFSEGMAPVKLNEKWGYIDKTGKEVIPFIYEVAGGFKEGLVTVKLNGKWGYVDITGEEVIPLKYEEGKVFSEGLAAVKLNGKLGYIDKSGKEVIPLIYEEGSKFSEGLAIVKLNGKCGYIDKSGKEVIPLTYEDFRVFSEGLAAVKLNEKWGFIDKTGKEAIPFVYDEAARFSEGLAPVKLNGKSGYIDKSGKEVIPLKYERAWVFSEGLAKVKLNGKFGYIDKTGKQVIPLIYDDAWDNFSEGMAIVKLKDRFFYIDKNGNEIKEK